MIVLSKAKAACPHCDHVVHQIDSSKEHAVAVVTAAMDRHIAAAHPEGETA